MSYFDTISTDLVMKSSLDIHRVTTKDIARRFIELFACPSAFVPIIQQLAQCNDSPKIRHWVSVSRSLLRSRIQTLDPEPRFISHFYVDSLHADRIVELHAFRALEIVIEESINAGKSFCWSDDEILFPPTFSIWRIGTLHKRSDILKGCAVTLEGNELTIQSEQSTFRCAIDGSAGNTAGQFDFSPMLIARTKAGEFVIPTNVPGLSDAYHSHAPVVRGQAANHQWITTLKEAVGLLHEQDPVTAQECLRLSPAALALHTGGTSFGSSSPQEVMGLIFLPGVADPYDLAECLLHESLHQKLYRVEEGAPLFQDGKDEQEIYYSPWRSDGRPLRMLVHGAYVFAGVSHFWRESFDRLTMPDDRENASFHCYYRAKQAAIAMGVVRRHDFRTDIGMKISEIIEEGIDSVLSGLNASPGVVAEADRRLDQHQARHVNYIR